MSNFKTNFRRREIKLIFNNIPKNYFDKGIELGAGSGIQPHDFRTKPDR